MMMIRSLWFFVITFFLTGIGTGQHINEFHYDNDGAGTGEFVEVFFPDPQPSSPTQYRIFLYNGADSMFYDSRGLQGIQTGCHSEDGGCYYIWERTTSFVQDGPRDGIALVYLTTTDTTVFDFISYEGTLKALDGPAKGMTSADIGIHEDNSTEIGWSLQKRDDGTWVAGPATKGSVNPIELLSFGGTYLKEERGVLLEWRTATELNCHYFDVQKSLDQRSFMKLAEIAGAGTSQQILEYSYFNPNVLPGKTFYRLKQVDYDGTFEYSPVIVVEVHSGNALSDINPIFRNGEIFFSRSDYRFSMDVSLFDVLGRRLLFRNQVFTGDVIPLKLSQDGIIFYHICSQGFQHSGRLLIMGQ